MKVKSLSVVVNWSSLTLLVIHWSFFLLGIYVRGEPLRLFDHFLYEPLLLKILFVLDIPGIFLGDLIVGPSLQGLSALQTCVYIILISLQWTLLGFAVDRIRNRS